MKKACPGQPFRPGFCYWCGHPLHEGITYVGNLRVTHAVDCPWVEVIEFGWFDQEGTAREPARPEDPARPRPGG